MSKDQDVFKESTQVIQEIESQLDKILQKKVGEIDRDLEGRILQEQESAHRRKEEAEKEIKRERETLGEYRTMVRETESERAVLLNEIKEHFRKILHFQGEIEHLAKATADEIKIVNEIQLRLEELRQRTADRAAFLKNDLRERFGIIADVPEDHDVPIKMDLELELEKLRKIKELLAMESSARIIPELDDVQEEVEAQEEPPASRDEDEEESEDVPEIGELIELAPTPEEEPTEPEQAPAHVGLRESSPAEPPPPVREEEPSGLEENIAADLETYRRTEPANGSGEIHYFQCGDKSVVDSDQLFAAIEKTLEEAQRLSVKLNVTESPKDQFFIKQELINWQEGLRALFLRIIKMSEKKAWSLPRYTADILNTQILRDFLERLSMENWSNPEEFALFRDSMKELRSRYLSRIEARTAYFRSLKEDIESE